MDGRHKVASFFSARPKRCPVLGDIYNQGFLVRPGPLPEEMNVAHLSPSGELLHQAKSSLPFDTFVHDSALSEHYLVYFLPPVYMAKDQLLSIVKGDLLGNSLTWHENSKAYVQIHSRDNLKMR
jgi:carotenoid cleavage dioxygenase-like enzyme